MTTLHPIPAWQDAGTPPVEPAGRELVVGFDDTPAALAALDWATDVSGRLDLPLRIVYAADVSVTAHWPTSAGRDPAPLRDASRVVVDRAVARTHRCRPGLAVHGLGLIGSPAAELVAQSAEAGLLVVGHRTCDRAASAVLGSVSMPVAMHARCPVVVVPEPPAGAAAGRGRPVVVGVDGSRSGRAAVLLAGRLARAWAAPVHVLSVWQPPVREPWNEAYGDLPDAAVVTEAVARAAAEEVDLAIRRLEHDDPDLVATGEPVRGSAADVLVRASQTAGLVVVGSRGLGGFAGMMLGSVSHAVLRGAHSPVAVVRRGSW